ncbi:hypothetical protein IGI04_030560 [Brassica rapa subsp. trilocularis]|uniref:Uncharacterized protein n=1 Tax=Brassica rapa subsp. trilocularis TaxID=1813537 RepID=A0ABQ7LR41_BRACM|nr:hypothetical protein IGI04_030560 [Brassica rapa subsp. trilocularis]
MCDKKVISLVETMKSVFPRFILPDDLQVSRLVVDDFQVSRLAVNDLHGSLLVNAKTTNTEVVRLTTYIEAVHDFIPRFWSNLAYLGRFLCKSSDGRLPCKSSRKK